MADSIKITSDGRIELSIEKKTMHIGNDNDGYQHIVFQANGDYAITQILGESYSPSAEHVFTEKRVIKMFESIKKQLIDKTLGSFEHDLNNKGGH